MVEGGSLSNEPTGVGTLDVSRRLREPVTQKGKVLFSAPPPQPEAPSTLEALQHFRHQKYNK